MRLTVGSEEPKVYWKRRAIAGGALVALVLVIVMGCRALTGGGSEDDAAPTSVTDEPTAPSADDATPSRDLKQPYVEGEEEDNEAASEEPEPTEEEVTDCENEALKLQVAAADETAVAGNEVPVGVIVTNEGDVDCVAPLEELRLVAVTGDEEVFSSEHCDDPYEPENEAIPAGDGEVAEFTFAGLATSEECEDEPRRLPSGDYDLVAIVDEWESEPESITLE